MKSFKIKKMKSPKNVMFVVFIFLLVTVSCTSNKTSSADVIRAEALASNQNMYVIEREVPGAGDLTSEELKSISQTSCGVLDDLGSEIQWLHSYVTGNKIYCVYTSPNEDMILEHAKQGGFPANSVSKVAIVIDPDTAK